MIPIHELLHRIRWDPAFGKGAFEVAYDDHVAGRLVRIPLARIHLEPGERFAFEATEDDGSLHMVPFHRVRAVWRDGNLIWTRPARKPV
jgi:uncharacterized protein (UPF0248 family)